MLPEASQPNAGPQPLKGCRVLDLSLLLPGPYCTWLLGCFGAEVIKIEPTGGDPVRAMNPAMFAMYNRGKHSVAMDLKSPADRERFLAMVKEADVVVEGFRPSAMDRLGLSVDTLRSLNPRLVVGSISGYGWTGPYRDHAGHDIGFLSLAGYFSVPSQLNQSLVRPQIRLADLAAGQSAALALTMAWLQARQTGQGSHVDASIYDATMSWTAPMMLATPDKPAHELPHVMADSALYATADGQYLCVATLEDKFWNNFAHAVKELAPALSDERWHTRRGRDKHKLELAEALTAALGAQPLAVWVKALAGVDTTVEPVYLGREALNDPQAQARGFFKTKESDGLPSLAFPALFDGQRAGGEVAVPTLGQDAAEQFMSEPA